MKNFLVKYKIIITGLILVILGIIIEVINFNLHRFSSEFHEFMIRFVVFGMIFTLSVVLQYYSNYRREQIQSNEKYQLIMENANDMISVINEKSEIEFYNESVYQRLLGYAKYKILIFGLICIILVTIVELLIFGNHEFPHEVHEILIFIMTLSIIFTLSVGLQYYSKQQIISVQKLKESEEKFANAFHSSPNMLAITRMEDGIIIEINEGFTRALGYSREEIVGMKVLEVGLWIKEADRVEFVRAIREHNEVLEFETQIRTKSGEILIGLISGAIITLNDEPHLITIVMDITDLKKAEHKLIESEEKYRNLINNISDVIMEINLDGTFNYISPQIVDITGYTVEEFMLLNSFDQIHPEDKEKVLGSIQKGIKSRKTLSMEYRTLHKDGNYIPISAKGCMINRDGKTLLTGVVRDNTERKLLENKLEEQNKELEKLNELKSEFLRRASHELKTPLISIKGFSDLILALYADHLDPVILSKLREINDGCERLENIINNLLKTSRLESPELKPKLHKENLSFLIKFCVQELKSLAERRNQSIELDIQSELYVYIEKEEIHDVLSNLLTNAIKYTPPMGKIEIKTELNEDSMVVSINDNGIGFTEEQKKKIFQQFGKIERYGQGLDLGIDGTGLGLYISKKIVESHGGKIWMESEGKSKGSTFYFTLPNAK